MPILRIIHPSCTLLVFCLLLAPGALEAQPGGSLKIDLGDTPVALAAFNGDGDWNLAVANLGSVSLLRGGNDGVTISNPALPSIPAGFFLNSIITGNFGGSGGQDLALVGDVLAGAFVLLGHPNQPYSTGFQSSTQLLFNAGPGRVPETAISQFFSGNSIVTADFNGDGIPDLAIAGAPFQPLHPQGFSFFGFTCSEDFHFTCFSAVQVLLGTGTGDFVPGTSNLINASELSGLFQNGSRPGNDSPNALVAGDFNGDGKIDLAVTNQAANTVVIMLGNGDGTFGSNVGFPGPGEGLGSRVTVPVGSNPLGIVAGDFNHDGKLDLAVANTLDNTVTVLLGDGTGNFAPTRDSPVSVGSLPQAIAIVDIDGNGSVDLATANYADGVHGTVSILRGRHDGTFRRQSDIPVGGGPVALTAGNFGNPGDSPHPHVGRSLAVANNAGYVTILFDLSGQGGNGQ